MLKYEMIRVDNRLLHGQVLMKWIKLLKVKRVDILSDALASESDSEDHIGEDNSR